MNGDGFDDVVIGADAYDNGQLSEGRAYVYLGSASGLAPSPAWAVESNQAVAIFGVSVDGAGDVNGDGFDDVIVGAYAYDNGQTDEGRAFVYLGSASGLATSPAWTAESNQASGASASRWRESGTTSDGFDDIAIKGPPVTTTCCRTKGKAFVYYGSASGP